MASRDESEVRFFHDDRGLAQAETPSWPLLSNFLVEEVGSPATAEGIIEALEASPEWGWAGNACCADRIGDAILITHEWLEGDTRVPIADFLMALRGWRDLVQLPRSKARGSEYRPGESHGS